MLPHAITEGMGQLSRSCLIVAIAALGIKTSLRKLTQVGWRPIIMLVGETIFLAALVLLCLLN